MFKVGDIVRVVKDKRIYYLPEEAKEYYMGRSGKVLKEYDDITHTYIVDIPSREGTFQVTYWEEDELELVVDEDKESLRDLLLDARSWLLSAANLVYYEEDEINDIDVLYSRMDLMGERIEEAICNIEIVLENWGSNEL